MGASEGEVVDITSLAAGGAGVGRLGDGMTVFVPRTATGDRVRLTVVRRHRRHAEARVAELLEPGQGRVDAPCSHFTRDRCGGCQWQHLSAGAQAAAKRRIVGDALRRIAKLDVTDPELVASPRAFGYRTSATLTVRRTGAGVTAGFHDALAPDRVFPLERCHIAREELQRLWEVLPPALGRLPPGDDVRLKLRVTPSGRLHALVSGGERAFDDGEPLAAAARSAGLELTVWWQPRGGAVRRVGGAEAEAAEVSFGQVNEEVASRLQGEVVELADARAGARAQSGANRGMALDLYAGTGHTAVLMARRGWEVILVERDAGSVRRAEQRARAEGVAVRCIAGMVESAIHRLLPADVVVVNPPRAGLGQDVSLRLSQSPPARLLYVSCDPATLARDLKRLGATPERLSVRCYDMFPQTSHVETVALVEYA